MTEVRKISIDSFQDELDWEMFIGQVGDEVERLANSDYGWHIEGRNMGRLHRSGYKDVVAETGWKLLRSFLPDTDVSIVAEFHEERMEFTVCHHDAPTGEFYIITPKEVETKWVIQFLCGQAARLINNLLNMRLVKMGLLKSLI